MKIYEKAVTEENLGLKALDKEFYSNEQVMQLLLKLYYLCDENYYEGIFFFFMYKNGKRMHYNFGKISLNAFLVKKWKL